MTINYTTIKALIAGAVLGSAISVIVYASLFQPSENIQSQNSTSKANKPLYWVSPMDPNYKRDKPGKSPMGMELVPVYEKGSAGADTRPGTIKISPEVVNNLGVRTVTAEYKPLHLEIKTVGYVQYDEDKLVHIHPRVEGWIEKLYVKAAGDPVEKGQPLYEIYSPELVNAQEELALALNRQNPRLLQAAENRLKALRVPNHAISNLKKTKKVKQAITMVAPQDGVVDNLNIREGFFVKPGTTMMSIGVLDQIWVEAEVFERQASQVKENLPVTMSLDYMPGREWQGKVDYIYPTLDAKTRTLKVRLRFDNKSNELKPNMFAQVVIHAKTTDESLLVPKEAVIRTGSFDRLVLALGDGRFKSVKVNVGRVDDQFAEILSGIKAGESVVASAQFLLDSESSKTSDFKRMNFESDEVSDNETGQPSVPNAIWVEATINSLMAGHRMINVSHQAIEEWQWPEMTMDFIVAEAVNFADLKQGMTLHIEITKNSNDQYLVSNVHFPSNQESDKNQDQKTDHNNMDASKPQNMSHDTMDHSNHNQ